MIFNTESIDEWMKRVTTWRPYFAWFPVFWDGGWAIFEWVERRVSCYRDGIEWEYRPRRGK